MLYNRNAETQLHTDASKDGLARMLLQRGNDKNMHVGTSVSHRTTEAEACYHSTRLKLRAAIWTMGRLHMYLMDIHFTGYIDCCATVYMNTARYHKLHDGWITSGNSISLSTIEKGRKGNMPMRSVKPLLRLQKTFGNSGGAYYGCTTYIRRRQKNDQDIGKKKAKEKMKQEMDETKAFVLKNGLLCKLETAK